MAVSLDESSDFKPVPLNGKPRPADDEVVKSISQTSHWGTQEIVLEEVKKP